MQMAFVVIGGYVVATAPVVARFIDLLARVPTTGRGAICYAGLVSMLASLLSWGFPLVFGGLLVRALARREDLWMDYQIGSASCRARVCEFVEIPVVAVACKHNILSYFVDCLTTH